MIYYIKSQLLRTSILCLSSINFVLPLKAYNGEFNCSILRSSILKDKFYGENKKVQRLPTKFLDKNIEKGKKFKVYFNSITGKGLVDNLAVDMIDNGKFSNNPGLFSSFKESFFLNKESINFAKISTKKTDKIYLILDKPYYEKTDFTLIKFIKTFDMKKKFDGNLLSVQEINQEILSGYCSKPKK